MYSSRVVCGCSIKSFYCLLARQINSKIEKVVLKSYTLENKVECERVWFLI